MIQRTLFGFAMVCAVLSAPVAKAQLIPAQFVFQGTFDDVVFGTVFEAAPFDVYYLQLTNNQIEHIFTLNEISFQGPWLQSAVTVQDGTDLALSAFDQFLGGVGDNFAPDTFWAGNGAVPTLFGNGLDNATNLDSDTVASLGTPWVAMGNTGTVAVFSVPVGFVPDASNYTGGGAIIDGQEIAFDFSTVGGVPPTAIFANAPYSVGDNTTVLGDILPLTLDATPSTGDGTLTFDWDLDGDGTFETAGGTSPTFAIADAITQFGGFGIDLPIGVQRHNNGFGDS